MSSLFSTPSMPTIEPATAIPDADSQQTAKARRRALAKETKASGVGATVLSDGGRETLGA